MKRNEVVDMTHGPLLGKILLFSLPLMASNILQLLFNAADIIVVGRFAGNASLAAVSSTVSVINLFTQLLIGLSVGVNVVIARYFGLGGSGREISRTLHTAVTVALVGGAALGALGILMSGWVLDCMNVPDDVRPLALLYMRIYFVGTPVTMLYNYGAAALRAAGDTRRPLFFLIISGVINVILNLISVILFHMDVMGVGLATIISQAVSAVLVIACLSQTTGELHFSWRSLCLDKARLLDMAHIGIPAGIQSCLFSLSNVVIQGAINSYGSVIIAAVGAASSIEGFIYIAMNSFHQSAQTFISQNLGARKFDRIGRVLRICVTCTLVIGISLSVLTLLFAQPLISIYNGDPAVIQAGAERLFIVASVYVIYGIADVLVGAIRGCGVPIVPVIISLLCTCAFRLIWIAWLDTSAYGVEWVYISYPISWVMMLLALAPFWFHLRRGQNREQAQSANATASVR